jgi:D-arabinose 1-dehydrogenase-like Zn-dependent alcohol dehydrogenase
LFSRACRAARPQSGERSAVIRISGLGQLAIQVSKAFGHKVRAITNSATKVSDAKTLGADEALVTNNHAGQELTDMGGADIILSFLTRHETEQSVLLASSRWQIRHNRLRRTDSGRSNLDAFQTKSPS